MNDAPKLRPDVQIKSGGYSANFPFLQPGPLIAWGSGFHGVTYLPIEVGHGSHFPKYRSLVLSRSVDLVDQQINVVPSSFKTDFISYELQKRCTFSTVPDEIPITECRV